MRLTSRAVVVVLVASLLAGNTRAAAAQSAAAQGPAGAQRPAGQAAEDPSFAAGVRDGEVFAENASTCGKVAVGCVGFFAGMTVIGTLGVGAVGPAGMTPEAVQYASRQSPDYQVGFKKGWEKKSRDKKRKAFMVGALAGFTFFALAVATGMNTNAGGATY